MSQRVVKYYEEASGSYGKGEKSIGAVGTLSNSPLLDSAATCVVLLTAAKSCAEPKVECLNLKGVQIRECCIILLSCVNKHRNPAKHNYLPSEVTIRTYIRFMKVKPATGALHCIRAQRKNL